VSKYISILSLLTSLFSGRKSAGISSPKKSQLSPSGSPVPDDHDAWLAYWTSMNQPWRREPEIDTKRQEELSKCHDIVPDIKKGIFPFKEMELCRADIEWLLATYGFVASGDACCPIRRKRSERNGLDLRGANLRKVDLTGLPLSHMLGGLDWNNEFVLLSLTPAQFDEAGVHLEGAFISNTHLDGAIMGGAYLEEADLTGAYLRGADLSEADLEGANLFAAHLEGAYLPLTNLKKTNLTAAYLQGTQLFLAHLEGASLQYAHLEGATLIDAHLQGAALRYAQLEGADRTEERLGAGA
jgi:uncharacterized protein YjbI with pentapeptide repeats